MLKSNVTILVVSLLIFNTGSVAQEFSLSGLIGKAINYHPSVRANASLEASAQHGVSSARWQYFPTPEFSINTVGSSSTDLNYAADSRVSVVRLIQPVWTSGRIEAGLAESKAQLAVRKALKKVSERNLSLDVVEAYSKWISSYLRYQTFSNSKDEHIALYERIKRRIKQGLSSSSDLDLVTSRLRQVEFNLNSAGSGYQSSLLNLEELVGEPLLTQNLIKHASGKYSVSPYKNSARKRALRIDPKIQQLIAESAKVKAVLKQQQAKLIPELRLKLERQWGDFSRLDANSENRVFLELASSFGAGLSDLSEIDKIKSQYNAALLELKSEKLKIGREFRIDWLLNLSLIERKTDLYASIQSAEKIKNSWYRQFLAGRKTWQDVMNSIREVTQLEAQWSDLESEQILVSWRLAVRIYGIDRVVSAKNPAFKMPSFVTNHTNIGSIQLESKAKIKAITPVMGQKTKTLMSKKDPALRSKPQARSNKSLLVWNPNR